MPFRSAEPITLDQLPKHSEWPDKILGEVDWLIPERSQEKVYNEYDRDKYQALLDFQKENNTTNPKDIKKKQLLGRSWQFSNASGSEPKVVISEDCTLYLAPVLETQWNNDDIIINLFDNIVSGDETIIELGAGYGYNFHPLSNRFQNCEFLGGELSDNAVKLASKIYENKSNVEVNGFNYYSKNWDILNREFGSDVILFTRLSIEQLPACGLVIEHIVEHSNVVDLVIHLEPVYEMYDEESLLGLLRKKYTEINDYNRDLLTELESNDGVEITAREHDLFGDNGLCPMSLIQWKPI